MPSPRAKSSKQQAQRGNKRDAAGGVAVGKRNAADRTAKSGRNNNGPPADSSARAQRANQQRDQSHPPAKQRERDDDRRARNQKFANTQQAGLQPSLTEDSELNDYTDARLGSSARRGKKASGAGVNQSQPKSPGGPRKPAGLSGRHSKRTNRGL